MLIKKISLVRSLEGENSIEKQSLGHKIIAYVVLTGLLAATLLLPGFHDARAATRGIWRTPAELQQLPMSGSAWQKLKSAADKSVGSVNVSDQNSQHDTSTLAIALVYARTGTASYRSKAADAIMSAIGTEKGGRTLALGRNLVSYVIAADLIDLQGYDAAKDAKFRDWLKTTRTETLDGKTLISTHEVRPNNWGTHAGASRVAVDVYLGDKADLDRAATVFKGWVGDYTAYHGFKYGDTSWQADPSHPVGINAGTSKSGFNLDGILPDDMRRGGSFKVPPAPTNYVREGLQGAIVQAELLHRAGYDSYNWSNKAILRAYQSINYLASKYSSSWAITGDDTWQPWIVNKAYGAKMSTTAASVGKNMAWTDWTHQ